MPTDFSNIRAEIVCKNQGADTYTFTKIAELNVPIVYEKPQNIDKLPFWVLIYCALSKDKYTFYVNDHDVPLRVVSCANFTVIKLVIG